MMELDKINKMNRREGRSLSENPVNLVNPV